MKKYFYFLGLLLLSACAIKAPQGKKKANIIYILADDLGYGDLSCYGQQKLSTPNIDRLAEEGMLFTQHYSGSTVCAPSRSVLMTGQHTGHTPVRGNRGTKPEGQHPLEDGAVTIAEVLKKAGYTTGAFGKWGLGFIETEGAPHKQGFDEFYGYNCQSLAHNYYPRYLWHNQEKIILEENQGSNKGQYAPDLIHEKTLEFIDKNHDKPFFLYIPNVIPHAELIAPEPIMDKYRGKFLPEKKYKGFDDVESERYRKGPYESQTESHAAFAAMIEVLDQQVKDILDKLEKLGIDDNTLIIFTSDNGPHQEGGADPKYFDSNGPLKGIKRDLYEGGIRVPMIAWWKNKIKKGSQTDHISAFWDVLPTLADLAETKPPKDIDGISFLPTFLNKGQQKKHEYLYWEFYERDGRIAIRKDNWKAVKYNYRKAPEAPFELYDLSTDISEENNVAEAHPELLKTFEDIAKEAHEPSLVFTFGKK